MPLFALYTLLWIRPRILARTSEYSEVKADAVGVNSENRQQVNTLLFLRAS
jgi:hypothetical protein